MLAKKKLNQIPGWTSHYLSSFFEQRIEAVKVKLLSNFRMVEPTGGLIEFLLKKRKIIKSVA